MPRKVSIGVCASLLSVLALSTAIASPRAGRDHAGGQGTRGPSPATETFHIAPGGPGYTTNMVFEGDEEYRFEISGTIIADEGGSAKSTLSAYHCLSGTFCDPPQNCPGACPPAKQPQNFTVFDERGLSTSIDNGKASAGPPPADGTYEFVFPGPANPGVGRLTFLPLPNGRYGGKEATFSGEGFTFKVTELPQDPSSCQIPAEWSRPAAARREPGCVWQVPFGFDLSGEPERPLPGRLPKGLIDMVVRTHGTKLVAERKQGSFQFTTRGRIELATEYRKDGGGSRVERITLSAFRRPLYTQKGGLRRVQFDAYVTASSDATCTKGTKLKVLFQVANGGTSPRLDLDVDRGDCLIGSEGANSIIWLKKSFDEGTIGDPQPR